MPARLPNWFRRPLLPGTTGSRVKQLLGQHGLHTVCEGAKCPNRAACWHDAAAAFLILGDTCTRDCGFCAIPHGAVLPPPDPGEPQRLAEAAAGMGLRYVVVTSVTRDDLPDGGAAHFAATIHALRARIPGVEVEVLIPDLQGDTTALDIVLAAQPDILNHNLETVARLQPTVRPQADYARSLGVLRYAAQAGARVKSGLMLGMGETREELMAALHDLRAAGVTLLTLGQYLAPSAAHHPVARFVPPEEFAALHEQALALGFVAVAAGPQVRSSYHAGELVARGKVS
ncbi:MAG TPA: lipoyl synthase [Kiritimatiellia bacterium]|jgi:lipoic acid synthetase|nr:MAG: Lipoyl synthase [Verrucomicrobia bacterium ADurb.Bin018]HOE00942.1 lipoyl synthase [Kiritimatiellia bacterium]HOE37089.1 lipoyl synthase [Kiritimatiellia bacterium]HOR74458.1 lipoyl synthase [Kiritimatiellia bacterium]HOU59037.1 lipoyl synthase [Kiritimatiellia bacterium]